MLKLLPTQILSLCLLFSMGAKAETLHFSTIDFCPFSCIPENENGKEGVMTEVLRKAMKEAGYDIEVSVYPFVRAIELAKSGVVDGTIVTGKMHAPELLFPQLPTLTPHAMFMVAKDNPWRYQKAKSLNNIVLGVIRGFDYVDSEINNYIRDNADSEWIYYMPQEDVMERAVKMLKSKRIDAYVDGDYAALYQVNKLGLRDEFDIAGYSYSKFDDFSAFNPSHPQAEKLAAQLTKTIQEMKASGEIQAMLASYGVK